LSREDVPTEDLVVSVDGSADNIIWRQNATRFVRFLILVGVEVFIVQSTTFSRGFSFVKSLERAVEKYRPLSLPVIAGSYPVFELRSTY